MVDYAGLEFLRETIRPRSRWDGVPFGWNGIGCFYANFSMLKTIA